MSARTAAQLTRMAQSSSRTASNAASRSGLPKAPARSFNSSARPSNAGSSSSGSSSGAGSSSSSTPKPSNRNRWLALSLIPVIGYWSIPFFSPRKRLNPQVYSDHPVAETGRLSPLHAFFTVPVDVGERSQFGKEAVTLSGAPAREGEIVVQHIMVKNPALMIERPYTPINDVEKDGEMDMVVKRIRGGEVGRMIHNFKSGDQVDLRGPITTMSLDPSQYDSIVMISTGTAVAPFLQLLAKATPSPAASTKFHLLHAAAGPERPDWSAPLLKTQQDKWGAQLAVNRIAPGLVKAEDIQAAIGGRERVLVLVCMPPNIMRPLCGMLTPTLQQGPLTGTLKEMGLKPQQVWKLE